MRSEGPVLILCNRVPYPLKDGGALAMHATIKGWHDTGRPVYVLAMNTSRHRVTATSLPALYGQLAGFRMVDIANDLRIGPTLRNFLFSSKPQHAERFYSSAFSTTLQEMIREVQPALIQVESIYLSEYLPELRRHSNALLVQRLHNIEYEVWLRLAGETRNPLKAFYLRNLSGRIRRYEQQVWQDFDLLLPITHADETYIRDSGCTTPMYMLPFGIDLDQLPVASAAEKWVGYHLGAMDWMPNREAMLWFLREIWPQIRIQVPDFEFYMAGRNMPDLFSEQQGTGFHCAGEVADARAFIADKKILLVPLRSGSGIRVKTLEAMAAGKIVISTATGIQGIEARSGEHFIEANTPAAFAAAIKWCLQNREAAEAIACQATDLLQRKYNQKRIMTGLVQFLKRMNH